MLQHKWIDIHTYCSLGWYVCMSYVWLMFTFCPLWCVCRKHTMHPLFCKIVIHESSKTFYYYYVCVQVEYLLEHGADVNRGVKSSSLHYAACFGRPNIVKLLLQYGADPELRDEDGHTPLEKAQERGDEWHRQVIEILENPSKWREEGRRRKNVRQERERGNCIAMAGDWCWCLPEALWMSEWRNYTKCRSNLYIYIYASLVPSPCWEGFTACLERFPI